jgi:hypothetical protein
MTPTDGVDVDTIPMTPTDTTAVFPSLQIIGNPPTPAQNPPTPAQNPPTIYQIISDPFTDNIPITTLIAIGIVVIGTVTSIGLIKRKIKDNYIPKANEVEVTTKSGIERNPDLLLPLPKVSEFAEIPSEGIQIVTITGIDRI